jgi:hypothetical protein
MINCSSKARTVIFNSGINFEQGWMQGFY